MATRRKFHVSDAQYTKALRESRKAKDSLWRLDGLEYDKSHRELRLVMHGAGIGVPVAWVSQLEGATERDLKSLYLTPSGDTVVAERMDVFLSVEQLVKEFVRTAIPHQALASAFGAKGGAQTSERKRLAASANGAKGGRPRKIPDHAVAKPAAAARSKPRAR